ncbi:MAG: zinc ribbon domain-containing protein [Candidatus Thorarchaeota archaeon]
MTSQGQAHADMSCVLLLFGTVLITVGLTLLALAQVGETQSFVFIFPFIIIGSDVPPLFALWAIVLFVAVLVAMFMIPRAVAKHIMSPTSFTTCPVCGQPLPPDARFCAYCGLEISGDYVDDSFQM